MRIVLFNWRDFGGPRSGGAELVTHVLLAGLAARGHDVTWFTSRAPGQEAISRRDDYQVIRRGTELTCRVHGARWLAKYQHQIDAVIDEVNTLPFLSPLVARHKTWLWIHQLAREIWYYETPRWVAPFGYNLEKLYLSLYRGVPTITGAASSGESFATYLPHNSVAIAEYPLEPPLYFSETVLPGHVGYVGRLTPSKRIDHLLEAFALVKRDVPTASLTIVGRGGEHEVQRLQSLASKLQVSDCVQFAGGVSNEERDALLASLDVLALSSVREGWGLVVSEAARFGVPSVVYPVAGLLDSVRHGETGIIAADQTPSALAEAIKNIITDRGLRDRLGMNAMDFIRGFTADRFVRTFEQYLLSR